MSIGERLAVMETDLRLLRQDVEGMRKTLNDVTAAVHISRGKRIALTLMGSAATVLITVAVWLVDRFLAR